MAGATWWQRVLAWVSPGETERQARIRELSRAIARNPQAAAVYVSRGEVYLQSGETAAAVQDFRQALALAGVQFKTEAWGVVAQSVRDRALRGLEQAQDKG